MEIILSVVLGIISFVCGQIFQQYVLVPIQAFARQRADTIYFAVHFKDSSINWDAEDKEKRETNESGSYLFNSDDPALQLS
jgi:hypothetical protein